MRILIILFLIALNFTNILAAAEPNSSNDKRKNVVLIVLDSVTANHIRHAEAPASYTPNFDKLLKQAINFTNFTSSSSWTKPSAASILTGLMPIEHRVNTPRCILADHIDTLPELLKLVGYQTLGVVSHTFLDAQAGYAQGFDEYYQVNNKGNTHAAITSPDIAKHALEWLEKADNQTNFFMFLHFFDPHFNFLDHPEFDLADKFAAKSQIKPRMSMNAIMRRAKKLTKDDLVYIKMLHAEEIALTDMYIGQVIDALEKKGILQDTLVILTADHGEEFLERGNIGHTSTLYQELVNVPFFIFDTNFKKPQTRTDVLSHVDILPTVLDLLDIEHEQHALPGRTFAPILRAEKLSSQPVYSDVAYRDGKNNLLFNKLAVRKDNWKLILDRSSKRKSLHNLAQDSSEKINLFETEQQVAEQLLQYIELYNKRTETAAAVVNDKPAASEIEYDKEELEQLKTLGYL